jgi:hypothetical protein
MRTITSRTVHSPNEESMVDVPKPTTMKHNPGFLTEQELIDSFIVRQAELESVLETLRDNNTVSNQHLLVIGPRGMGKTMLVHRVALAIRRDDELASRWYPILMGEEAYNVGTAGEFWLEALHQLARQTQEPRWHEAHVALRRDRDNRRLRDLALARLLDFADEHEVRLMVAVENLQTILGQQMPEDEGWIWRHTLLNEPRIMLLATATARFDDIENPKKAAYELFGILRLRPLTPDAIRALWERSTGERLEGRAYRILEIFTGGNPRLLTVLGGFARGRTLRAFMADLLGLIDDHADWFKFSIEALPPDERRVFGALCELWEPSSARAVGEVARFDVNKTSMLLGRLVDRGAVEITHVKGRAKFYQTSERLYSLFHRLRRDTSRRDRAVNVVEFIVRYYLPERHSPPGSSHLNAASIAEDPDHALEVLRDLARENPDELLDIHREALLQLAITRPEGVHALASITPFLEPLAFALARELGHDVLAPHEVAEVAKDIRAELRELRGPMVYTVEVPHFAAAEDAPLPRRRKHSPKRRQPSKRRL